MPETSTKPYMLRAIYEWCTDNGYTPYLAVKVDGQTRVPMQFVNNGEIVLNISFDATSGLKMENDSIHFNARFGGVSREIFVPVDNVLAIYARENGQGMAFDPPKAAVAGVDKPAEINADTSDAPAPPRGLASVPTSAAEPVETSTDTAPEDNTDPPKKGGRAKLTRIK